MCMFVVVVIVFSSFSCRVFVMERWFESPIKKFCVFVLVISSSFFISSVFFFQGCEI